MTTKKPVIKYQMHGQSRYCQIPEKDKIFIAKNDTRDRARWVRLAGKKVEEAFNKERKFI